MSEASLQEEASVESLVARVADEFLERQKNGDKPDIEEYAARYPDAADLLRKVLAALELIGQSQRSGTGYPEATAEVVGTLGDFRIVREVGRGGMGVVYEAEQISLRRRVALKVLPFAATMDPRHLQRFHNEAQAAACLHHTNIVPVFFVGSERGVHFYAMQFIDGQPLSESIRQLGQAEKKEPSTGGEQTVAYKSSSADDAASTPPPAAAITPLTGEGRRSRDYFRKVAELGVQAAEALDYAHQLGIVHRDIKPANLLLDGRGNVWVTDFGLAQVQHGEANLTLTGQAVGTPRYMSPEQALAKRAPIDHRTDVYSLGVTLYELLTLRPAFSNDDRQELLRQIAFEEPPRPRRRERTIPAELEIIVLKAMEKRPQDRYATAQELADDLRHWLEDRPIRARRPSWSRVARKWVRRHQAVVWSAAVCVLMIVAVVGANIGWIAGDRAALRANAAASFDQAAKQAIDFVQHEQWPEAKAAVQRAADLLAGVGGDPRQQQRLEQLETDLNMAWTLELIRLRMTGLKDGRFDPTTTVPDYANAFRSYNLPVLELDPNESARLIAASPIRAQLLAGMEFWGRIHPDRAAKKKLAAIRRMTNRNPWLWEIWDAMNHQDRARLIKLTESAEALDQPPTSLVLLGYDLARFDKPAAAKFLRQAQQHHPDDFWINHHLALTLATLTPPRLEEAIGFYRAAVALRPQSSGVHLNLARALSKQGRSQEAIAEYRKTIYFQNDYAEAHHNLGDALQANGQLNEAIAEYRKAIQIKKDYLEAHNDLGATLYRTGRIDEAIAALREAIEIRKDNPEAHSNLGAALRDKGQLDEAIAEFREAIRHKTGFATGHFNLAVALSIKGQLDESIAEYRESIRLEPDGAVAHCNLGGALEQKGAFAEALVYRRRGHELGSKDPSWSHPSAQWVRNCERLVELDGKLPAILNGKKQAADTAERLALAQLCQMPCKKLHATAFRFYCEAFAAKPQLANDLNAQHCYNAACAAALAGCGQGKDTAKLDDKERARLRQQALDWLRADLNAYRQLLEKSAGKAGPAIAQRMQHWLHDDDFAGVRGAEALAQLPQEERKQWLKLWQEADALRQRTTQVPKSASSAQP